MKKYIVLLIGTCLSILCSAQNHHAIQVYHGSDVHSYSFAGIDSIAHDREFFIRIYGNFGEGRHIRLKRLIVFLLDQII